MVRRDQGFNPWSNHTKDSKIVLGAALLDAQHYKVWSNLNLGVVAIEKGVIGSPSTKIANFTYLFDSCMRP